MRSRTGPHRTRTRIHADAVLGANPLRHQLFRDGGIAPFGTTVTTVAEQPPRRHQLHNPWERARWDDRRLRELQARTQGSQGQPRGQIVSRLVATTAVEGLEGPRHGKEGCRAAPHILCKFDARQEFLFHWLFCRRMCLAETERWQVVLVRCDVDSRGLGAGKSTAKQRPR